MYLKMTTMRAEIRESPCFFEKLVIIYFNLVIAFLVESI